MQNHFLRDDWTSALMAQAQEFDDFMSSRNHGTSGCPMNNRHDVMRQLFEQFVAPAKTPATPTPSTSSAQPTERAVAPHDLLKNLFDAFIAPPQTDAKNSAVLKKDAFEVNVDCEGYEPSELTVKVADGYITVSGKHESKSEDGSSFVARQFTRKHLLPKNVNIDAINSKLSDGKVLRIEAPLLAVEAPKDTSIPIAVIREEPAAVATEEQAKPADAEPMLD